MADRINTKLDVREQVFSSQPKPVITEDNLVVNIDTVLPHLAQGGNTFWVIPGELTQAVRTITDAFSDYTRMGAPAPDKGSDDSPPSEIHDKDASRQLTSGGPPSLDAAAAAERVAELAEAAVNEAKAEAAANDSEAMAAQSSSKQDAERGPTEIATHRTGAACSSDSPTTSAGRKHASAGGYSLSGTGSAAGRLAALASHFSLVAGPGPAVTSGPTGTAPPQGTLDISPQAGGRASTLLGRH